MIVYYLQLQDIFTFNAWIIRFLKKKTNWIL